ncbi:FHA domain-containing protein, partial [candidate division KSB1 bacterium]|nr:FHA domain-containing protein [candidate division KSB1 bacterium]NIR70792.1 FHA domain-containing protein [candidate division KSB1 bacterium]NIS27805.1 FHA domain-containing protein [candidate division KSB1 bacterium]NIT74687.1 FHA domain-containing protein [candidate division KSB1 bacterium]NIU28472.1 FHA domain-containing protein [candidate division KSB1 bacterium]
SKNYYVLGIYGYYLGKKFRITAPETRIGRDRKLNHIVIKRNSKGKIDQSVSRRHAKITYKNNKYKLTDKRSKSRTYINQKKLGTDEEVELRTGDEIEIISDRKSHILRFVPEGKWDFSFPKKAGAWHIRHRMKILNVYSLIVILLACFFFGKAFLIREIITERPNPLLVQEQDWYSGSANGQTNGANPSESLSQPAMADLNGDDILDLIYISGKGSLTSLNGLSKTPLWINDEVDAIPNIPVTVADLNNDRKSDIIVVSNDSRLRAIDGNWGIEIWRSPILAGSLIGPPVVDDFNGDGLNDLAISSSTNAVYLGYSSLRNSRWIKLDLDAQIRGIASAGDITLDGIPEVIIGTDTGKIVFIDGTNEKIWGEININEELNKATGRFNQNNQIRHPVGYGDLNGDGTPDLLVSTIQGNIIALDGSNLERLWYDWSDASPDTESPSEGGTALGDLDGDGLPDVVSIFPDGELKALKGTGQARDHKMLIWRKPVRGPDRFVGKPALADLNKNGTQDVIVANNTGALHILEGATGELLWREKGVWKPVIGSALVGDLDNNHTLDIIVLKATGKFYKLATNSLTYENSVVWGQVFGNNRNTHSATVKEEKISTYYANMGISVAVIAAVLALHFYFRNRRKKLAQVYLT